ncbi:peptidoglycan-binding protein [Ruminococcus bromii]|jgi:peptidoglycan hydrolase-like protein with peptidoglycan-binding domain|uniref:peptidoglycan-binding protein n=1 Tax=Ruminococcus bromii TaxID=40518 RepID=UPI00243163A5|nr:peptidoglycan-binding protein [Ruminococcus bromii]
MQRIKKITAIILSVLTLSSVCVFSSSFSAGAKGTGAGLAEWALNAYNSGWSYVYGGSTPGAVDCSGLIYSYAGGERCGNPQLETATETGSVSAGIPNVHGLGLWRPGHVGVYVGNGMEVDARGDEYGVCYEAIGGYNNWTYWFKLAAVSYVTNGWESFNGSYYYYENGEYIVNTSRTIDGTTYYFDSQGRSSKTPSDTSSSSSSSSSSGSDNSSGSSSSSASDSSGNQSSSSNAPSVYKNGSSGAEVKKIQQRLADLGYYNGAIDGNFGDATEEAYKAFQKAAGLTVDGIAGDSRNTLYSEDAPEAPKADTTAKVEEDKPEEETTAPTEPATEPTTEAVQYQNGDEGEKITAIQQQLIKLGYFAMEATGYYGEYTAQTVANFQNQNSLDSTGIVDEKTYNALFSDKAVANPDTEVVSGEVSPAVSAAPIEMPSSTGASQFILSNEKNQNYSDTASSVAVQSVKSADRALAKSKAATTPTLVAAVQRSANVGLWFALVAVILGAIAFVFFLRDRKLSRYSRYVARKKKRATKDELNTRW